MPALGTGARFGTWVDLEKRPERDLGIKLDLDRLVALRVRLRGHVASVGLRV